MRISVGSQVCAVIMHELVLIFNKSQKGKELGRVQVLNSFTSK